MTLTLRIENHEHLDDGGPLSVTVDERGLEAGRDSSMGWTLPDPNRFVSGRHFEIRHANGTWQLYDLSTNGTFVNGSSTRAKSPYQLQNGDRLQVGQYRIAVEFGTRGAASLADPFAAKPQDQGAVGAASTSGDIWSLGMPASSPATGGKPFDPHPPKRQSDFGSQHIEMPRFEAPSSPSATSGGGTDTGASPFGPPPETRPGPAPSAIPSAESSQAASPFGPAPASAAPAHNAPSPEAFRAPPPAPAAPAAPVHAPPVQRTGAGPSAEGPGVSGSLLDAICAGAGLEPGTLNHGDPEATAREIGQALRVVTEELAALLRARAVTKQSVRSGQRTMIGPDQNNPLKFMPGTDEALNVMFGKPRPGYQRGTEAIQSGFQDVKRHQFAVHAAIQPALARLLEDLAPEAIEAKVGTSRLSSKKARAWEVYVERWDAKVHPFENGMLDVFLAYFAEAYDQGSKGGGSG